MVLAPLDDPIEEPYYNIRPGWYLGGFAELYDPSQLKGTKILEDNYEVIKEEILEFYKNNHHDFKINFTPYKYREGGWKTLGLYSYFYKRSDNIEKLPRTNKILQQIPGMCGALVGVLEPNTRIKAHIGDTSAIIRSFLGIQVPGDLPEIGLRIGSTDICPEEGKVAPAFTITKRHYAWNYTNQYRIVLSVDVLREQYWEKKYRVASNTLAGAAIRVIGVKFPFLKTVSPIITSVTHRCLSIFFWLVLFIQRKTNLRIEKLIHS